MNIRISLGMAIAIMLMLGAVIFSITRDYTAKEFEEKINDLRLREAAQAKYAEIDREVRENSYYGISDETALLDSVARGYLAGIGDGYASYIDARTYERLGQEDQLAAIGALVRANPDGDGYLIVEEVYADSPAESAEMQAGDLIIQIDEVDLTPGNSVEMLDRLSGEEGTRVSIVFRRDRTDTTVSLIRRAVTAPTVYSEMLDDGVAYIWIKDFAGTPTSEQFRRQLSSLMSAGANSLILDVRDNPGTRLETATRILDQLCPVGDLVSEEQRDGSRTVISYSDASEVDLPMVVLVNEKTESAAELFAQALKDFDKARIVGATTAGNGVVLKTIKLSDGSAIAITVGKLIPPNGVTFDEIGVKPDYDVSVDGDWQNQTILTDSQLRKAHEVAVALQRSVELPPDESSEEESSEAFEPDPVVPDTASSQDESSEEESSEDEESSEGDGEEGDESSGDDESSGEESSEDESA